MITGVTIIGPLIEEVMYRGLLQNGIRRVGATPWAAITIASTVFAVAHVNVVPPHGLVGLCVLSLGFGWAFERSGTLWAPFTMHALFNAGNILLASGQAGVAM
jgi:membrane protease YdiL (CAAX protease family)